MRAILLLALAAGLAGCSLFEPVPPVVVTVAAEPPQAARPPECSTADDPQWRDLPAGDADQEDGARNYLTNKRGMRELGGRRRVCEAALAKLYPLP